MTFRFKLLDAKACDLQRATPIGSSSEPVTASSRTLQSGSQTLQNPMFRIRPSITQLHFCRSKGLTPFTQIRCAGPYGRPKSKDPTWTAERLATNDDYPLTSILSAKIKPVGTIGLEKKKAKTNKTKPDRAIKQIKSELQGKLYRTRPQIVSADLCGTLGPGQTGLC